jgi:ABC-type sulfate/molybdate transport systems ATPase subunit
MWRARTSCWPRWASANSTTAGPRELSGGMRQRAAIVRALIHDPPLLLMDEPFGALDALTREQMRIDLEELWMQTGKTVLFITHSIDEAVLLADRVIVMSPRPGLIEQVYDIARPRPRGLARAAIRCHRGAQKITESVFVEGICVLARRLSRRRAQQPGGISYAHPASSSAELQRVQPALHLGCAPWRRDRH